VLSTGSWKVDIKESPGFVRKRSQRWCNIASAAKVGREIRLLRRRLAERSSFGQAYDTDKHINISHWCPDSSYQASSRPSSPPAMPIIRDFAVPKAASELDFPAATDAFFIAFLASVDPQTNKPWCPDVVAALPTLEAAFSGADAPQVAFVDVGLRPEYDC
jgi:hypothetical protein